MSSVSKSQNISDPTLNALLCILIKPQPGRRLGEKFKLGLVHIWHTWKIRLRNSSELLQMHFKACAHPPSTHQHMIWNRLMRWSQYHSSNCQTQCLAKSNHTTHTVPIFLTCWLWSMAGAKLQRTEIVRANYLQIQNINTIQIQIQKYKFQQRVGGHPQMGASAYGLERNIGGKISTKINIQI